MLKLRENKVKSDNLKYVQHEVLSELVGTHLSVYTKNIFYTT